jgi:hypothetical protein
MLDVGMLLGELAVVGDKLGDVDPLVVGDDGLLGLVAACERLRAQLDVVESGALAELDGRGTTEVRSGHKTVGWLAAEARLSRRWRTSGCGWVASCGTGSRW